MRQLSEEILVYSRACEHLLSTECTLNDDESSLVQYYIQELSRKFGSSGPTMQKAAGQQ
jgi:vesicle coat complex subunit